MKRRVKLLPMAFKKEKKDQYEIRVTLPGAEPFEGKGWKVVNDVVRHIGPRQIMEKNIMYNDFPLVFPAGTKRPERINCTYGIERDEKNKPVLLIQTPGGSEARREILQNIKEGFALEEMVIERLD